MNKLLDGQKIANEIQGNIKKEILTIKQKTGKVPGLAVIIVGENPASRTYVRKKHQIASELGVQSQVIELEKKITKDQILQKINSLNQDENIHAVLIQLPLPAHLDTWEIVDHLKPEKDVDRFLPINLGKILLNRTHIFPCTPAGIMYMLDYYQIELTGMNAVVVGRSHIVGKPIAGMLTNRNATVTLCHSQTKNLSAITRKADLVIAAVGKAGFITSDQVKKGSILIDVGQNFLYNQQDVSRCCSESQQKKFKKKGYAITGDIQVRAFKKSSYYTPVPGGVGPMTVSMLMQNTLTLFKQKNSFNT